MTADDEEDLRLTRTSAGLLADLETVVPRICWKKQRTSGALRVAHRHVKREDLEYVLGLIEPFQEDPQLLDTKLKIVLPDIVDAYLQNIHDSPSRRSDDLIDAETALTTILYTFCKVRGRKIIIGFLNNEPRFLEPILARLESCITEAGTSTIKWQIPYVLLLWLSHLLLVPFDLATISTVTANHSGLLAADATLNVPSVVSRALSIGLYYIATFSKAQEAAALVLTKLIVRPDVQKLGLAKYLVEDRLRVVTDHPIDHKNVNHEVLGSLRFLSNVAASADMSSLLPQVFQACVKLSGSDTPDLSSHNAVVSKLLVKAFRNLCILCLRESASGESLTSVLDTTVVIETSIEYFLESLSAQDSPVRFAAAKAISAVISELDGELGHEIIQALLDMFKEDILKNAGVLDFRAVNPLKWHGLTLALAHTLFKRTTSPDQIPDTLSALITALQFEQRSATGSVFGTNVRDAANFGIWSLARRYTTAELKSVSIADFSVKAYTRHCRSIIQLLAVELVVAACTDPAGNIRRGSSAALQELVGRHPDEVFEGIALIQIVDYQAVGLRSRAMTDISSRAALLHKAYHGALLEEIFGWRGLGSNDIPSRVTAAHLIATLVTESNQQDHSGALQKTIENLNRLGIAEIEMLHGLVLTVANLINSRPNSETVILLSANAKIMDQVIINLDRLLTKISLRTLQAELPTAVANFLTAVVNLQTQARDRSAEESILSSLDINHLAYQVFERHEDTVLQTVPQLVNALQQALAKQEVSSCVGTAKLQEKVVSDSHKSGMQGAGFAVALGVMCASNDPKRTLDQDAAIETICDLVRNPRLDRRIIGLKAIGAFLLELEKHAMLRSSILEQICKAILIGTRDYTITDRGDVGSLVRLEAIACADGLLIILRGKKTNEEWQARIRAAIYRLSLEKLDRVRLSAAQCRARSDGDDLDFRDIATVSTLAYFVTSLQPLLSANTNVQSWSAIIEGCMSCAGAGNESLMQASRSAVVKILWQADGQCINGFLTVYMNIVKAHLEAGRSPQPALELLAFLLDMGISSRLMHSSASNVESGGQDFKWRSLLLLVQRSHYKSPEIARILAAVRIYHCLASVPQVREETLKKLFSMLRTNPYPRVRLAVVETLFLLFDECQDDLKGYDWKKSGAQMTTVLDKLQAKCLSTT